MQPVILALETATEACSVALICADNHLFRYEIAPKAHTQLLLPMIAAVLDEAKVTLQAVSAIAVSCGPGSFTGVRIGVSAAQALGFALKIPIYPVSTLAALAYQAPGMAQNPVILPMLDARMQEVYYGLYQWRDEQFLSLTCDALAAPKNIILPNEEIIAVGSGWDNYYETLSQSFPETAITFLPNFHPHAKAVGLIAQESILRQCQGLAPQDVLPVYLRDTVARAPQGNQDLFVKA